MSDAKVLIEDAPVIFFDFAPSYYNGMWDAMYRVNCGTMYVEDIDYVEDMINEAHSNYNGKDDQDGSWYETILSSMDEIRSLKRNYKGGSE